MILLSVGPEMLARLMAAERGPDTAWLLAGPTDEAVVVASPSESADEPAYDWPLAAE